jgi:hypothetical protein
MSHHAFEFVVVGYTEGEQYRVVGRNGDEDIKVGDSFDVMYRYKRPATPDDSSTNPVRESEREVQVRVIGIEAMNRKLGHLGVGMTGALTIEGDGIGDIAPGWILGRREPQPVGHDRGVNGDGSHAG